MRARSRMAVILLLGLPWVAAAARGAPSSFGEPSSPPADPSASAGPSAPVAGSPAPPPGSSARPGVAPSSVSSAPARLDPKGKKGISPYTAKLLKGHAAYAARDFAAAADAYREAMAENGAEPAAYCFLGETELAAGNAAAADATLQKGLTSVGSNDEGRAKLLFLVALLRERQGRLVDAKKAWEEYMQFLTAHPALKAPAASGSERSKALDTHFDLESKYAAVKERIEQRLRENGAPAPDSTQPAPARPKK